MRCHQKLKSVFFYLLQFAKASSQTVLNLAPQQINYQQLKATYIAASM